VRTIRRIAVLVSATAFMLGLAAANMPAAHADWNPNGPTASVSYGSQYGWVLRSVARENSDGSGYSFTVYGSSTCSATASDKDDRLNSLPDARWDNNISWASDFNLCDTALYDGTNLSGLAYGYTNFGNGATVNGSTNFNDKTSSFYLT
jgi:hypothetical protein